MLAYAFRVRSASVVKGPWDLAGQATRTKLPMLQAWKLPIDEKDSGVRSVPQWGFPTVWILQTTIVYKLWYPMPHTVTIDHGGFRSTANPLRTLLQECNSTHRETPRAHWQIDAVISLAVGLWSILEGEPHSKLNFLGFVELSTPSQMVMTLSLSHPQDKVHPHSAVPHRKKLRLGTCHLQQISNDLHYSK